MRDESAHRRRRLQRLSWSRPYRSTRGRLAAPNVPGDIVSGLAEQPKARPGQPVSDEFRRERIAEPREGHNVGATQRGHTARARDLRTRRLRQADPSLVDLRRPALPDGALLRRRRAGRHVAASRALRCTNGCTTGATCSASPATEPVVRPRLPGPRSARRPDRRSGAFGVAFVVGEPTLDRAIAIEDSASARPRTADRMPRLRRTRLCPGALQAQCGLLTGTVGRGRHAGRAGRRADRPGAGAPRPTSGYGPRRCR